MKQFLYLCVLLFTCSAFGQEFEISGTLIDNESKLPLESATVFVEHIADSSLVSYTISDEDGKFTVRGSDDAEKLRLMVSYAGYFPIKKIVDLNRENIELGTIPMKVATNELGEVMVVATRAPMAVKQDTLEFNADSFKTKPDANLEDVLEKLPGVKVDLDGNITVNGKPVSQILVNGEEFFGSDPKIASKNLPKEIIDKIQVVNTKTKSEEFTGKAGDPDNKTINITIDEDKNHGYFARATAGGGTNERYELSAIANYFNDELRLSVLASGNNINETGFSFDELRDAGGWGFARNFRGGGNGITKSEAAGLNFSNKWKDKYEFNADYFFGKNDTETMEKVERTNFLPDRTYYSNSVSEGNFVNKSHRANASFEVEFDTLTKLSVSPRLRIDNGFSRHSSSEETLNESRELTNSSTTLDNEETSSTEFGNRINFIRRFGGRGAYLQASFRNENEWEEDKNFFLSDRTLYENGEIVESEEQNQFIEEENTSDEYNFEISQRLVMMDDFFLDLSYDFSTENSTNNRNVYDFNAETEEYSLFNETLSSSFEVNSVKHIPNVGLNYEGEELRIGFNVGLLNTSLETQNYLADVSFDNNYNNLYLNADVRYEIKKGTSIFFGYRNDTDIPSIRELQPVPDITNPLNIVVGNPELKPTFNQNFRFRLHNFDWETRSGFFSYASLSLSENQVVPYTLVDDDLVRTTTFRNVDGGLRANLGGSYRKTIKKNKAEYSYNFGAWFGYNKQIGFTNGIQYQADSYNIDPNIGVGYNYNDLVEFDLDYRPDYVFSRYDINDGREVEYINHSLNLEATSYWPGNWVYANDISYNYYGNVSTGFDNSAFMWNMSLGYKFLNDDATLKVRVYDLLNQNISTRRSVGRNFVQDTETLILEQYFMLSFTYKLSLFGGKAPKKGNYIIFD
ncbi:MAG TPA: outer membrane beta-barrel protein [Salinimicrobium sp.]|nr:outer membrane beta-barrel protein [Salinimicrobium sp.]